MSQLKNTHTIHVLYNQLIFLLTLKVFVFELRISLQGKHRNKRYFIIDQQITRHFVFESLCVSNPSSFYAIINTFLI